MIILWSFLRARLVEVEDEAAERVARDEQLALELDACRRRGVVGIEPLLDGAAFVRMAVYLFAFATGRGDECRARRCGLKGECSVCTG